LGGSAVAGPPFLSLSAFFVFCGGWAFFRGVLRKKGVLLWCFCGEVVVNRGALMADFWRLKKCHFLKIIFIIFLYFCEANG
jgi:hypothetical protein